MPNDSAKQGFRKTGVAPMKAITLWQPWASLMAMGEKKIETRTWKTTWRGPLAIHAAAHLPPGWLGASRFRADFRVELSAVFGVPLVKLDDAIRSLPRGAVLCLVNLVDIVPTEQVQDISAAERIFGNYEEGRYAWMTDLMGAFTTPIPAKGNRMIWKWEKP